MCAFKGVSPNGLLRNLRAAVVWFHLPCLILLLAMASPSWAFPPEKVLICHRFSNFKEEGFKLKLVKASSVPNHMLHGDHFPITFYSDADGDGFGAGEGSTVCLESEVPEGSVQNDTDCDDGDAAINPSAAEICDGVDNDCDGTPDDGLSFDADGDGHTSENSCEGTQDDCDDNDPTVHPGAVEVIGDGHDNDCTQECIPGAQVAIGDVTDSNDCFFQVFGEFQVELCAGGGVSGSWDAQTEICEVQCDTCSVP